MNSSVINSSQPFNHSSSGSSLQLSYTYRRCITLPGEFVVPFLNEVINVLVGYPANIMVIWLIARKKSDSSTSDIFILNLAISDAFYCMMTPINYIGYDLFRIEHLEIFPIFFTFTYGIKNSNLLFLTCICLDRYVAVAHPIVFSTIKNSKIRVAISLLVWGLMLAFTVCRTLWLNLAGNIYIGLILAAFTIMVFCNISIIWSLRKSVFGKEKMHPMKKKALRTVQIYLAIIVFHYLPAVVIMTLRHNNFPEFCIVERNAFSLMFISASTEPLIYISQTKHLPWLKNFLCICCRSPSHE